MIVLRFFLPIVLVAQASFAVDLRTTTGDLKMDGSKVGIVVIDMWNYHWCMTAAHRVGAIVPRMNKALEAARRSGMRVFWAPTDVASQYAETPQREASLALPLYPRPNLRELSRTFTARRGDCMCGPGIVCKTNYGWDGMNPA
jgi:hypothetical protein